LKCSYYKSVVVKVLLGGVDERVAGQLVTLSRRMHTYKLQLYTQRHRDLIHSVSRDPDDDLDLVREPGYVDMDTGRSQPVAGSSAGQSQLARCGITRSQLQPRRRFSVF